MEDIGEKVFRRVRRARILSSSASSSLSISVWALEFKAGVSVAATISLQANEFAVRKFHSLGNNEQASVDTFEVLGWHVLLE